MVCYATAEPPRCQCIVRDSNGEKVYEVTLPASTPATSLLHEVAKKLDKCPDEISLIYQNITKVIEITDGTRGSLEDVGLKTSHNRNSLMVQELGNGSSEGSISQSHDQASDAVPPARQLPQAPSVSELSADSGKNIQDRYDRHSAKSAMIPNRRKQRVNNYTSGYASSQLASTSLESSPSPNFVGLVNQAMTCYLNSLLQALYMTPEFRNALYKWKYDDDKPSKSVPFQLQKLFLNLQTTSRCAVETTELTLSFGWGTGDVWHQHDVQELCRVMFDALEQEFKNTSQADLINHLYQGKMIDYVKCLECDREKSREDTFLDIPLPVRPYGSNIAYSSIEEAMQAFVTPEILDGNNQYYCENCKKKCNAHKGLKFSKFPYLLTLHLKRFDFDYTTMHRIKLNDKVVFPEILELDCFLKDPSPGRTEAKCDDGSTSTADSALGDDTVSTSAAPALPPELNSPPTDHELNEDEGIEISLGAGSGSSSSSHGSYSGSESCDNQTVPCNRNTTRDAPLCEESSPAQTASSPLGSEPTTVQTDAAVPTDATVPTDTSVPPAATADQARTVPQIQQDTNYLNNCTQNDIDATLDAHVTAEIDGGVDAGGRPEAEFRYELYSIMIHSGSASGGHYYAYIKDFETCQWFCFNDQSVTKVTNEDIEKSYGGGPTRGYYSGVFSSSTNAYMLMYRLIDPENNCLPITCDEFPLHIKTLVEKMKADEEEEKRQRARDEEMVKVKVCYQSNQTKVFVHRDDPFSEALRQAYENLQLDGHVRKEDCRLVSYCISQDLRDCSVEDRENDTMGNVLTYLKDNSCSTDFLLETKHPDYHFNIYRPDDLRINVCRVNVAQEEVLGIQEVQVPAGINVSGLKDHLRSMTVDLLMPPFVDLVLVLRNVVAHNTPHGVPSWTLLDDDESLIRPIINPTYCYQIFVALLTPALSADLAEGFNRSNFLNFLKRVENVLILHIVLPEVNEDILEHLMIPVLNKHKAGENNNKQDMATATSNNKQDVATATSNNKQDVATATSNNKQDVATATSNNKLEFSSDTNGAGNAEEESAVTSAAVTSSDQSTSEDSSLTDSERTIIGEPPQLEGQLSSPSDSEQLFSPETNMTMEINGDVDEEGSDESLDGRVRTGHRDYYIKVALYIQNNQRMLKVVVDRQAEWSLVEKYVQLYCGVPKQYLLVTTGSNEVVRSSDTLKALFKHLEYLNVKLHRPLKHNEIKKKLYKFLLNSPQPFQYICDWIIVRGQTVGESKRALIRYLERRKLAHIPYNRCRLRRKNWKSVGRPWLDTDVWDEPKHAEEILLEQLESDDPVTAPYMIPIFIRRVFPYNRTFSTFLEIVIDASQPYDLLQQLIDVCNIPAEYLAVTKCGHNFPWDTPVFMMLQDLQWYQDISARNIKFCLDTDENTPIILFRDMRDMEKKMDANDEKWNESTSSGQHSDSNAHRSKQQDAVFQYSSDRRERLAMQSPRKEKPLKIYLQSKNNDSPTTQSLSNDSCSTTMPSSNSSKSAASSSTQSTDNYCNVPLPDYD